MVYIGIDPGKTGAVAFIDDCQGEPDHISLHDMPLDDSGRVDACGLLNRLQNAGGHVICFLEKSQAMPGQGVTSTFNYGTGYGSILACLQIANVPFQEVHPMSWKKEFTLVKKDKSDSVAVASRLFPQAFSRLRREKRGGGEILLHGRAEALLLAEYCRRRTRGC